MSTQKGKTVEASVVAKTAPAMEDDGAVLQSSVINREDGGSVVWCKFIALKGMSEVQSHSRPGPISIGQLQARLQKRLKLPTVFLCLQVKGEAFMPLPDLTLEQLAELYGERNADNGNKELCFSASTTTESFP